MVEHEADTVHEQWQALHAPAALASFQVICAWCQHHIVWHWVPIPLPFPISYSICTRCYADVTREFAPRSAGAALPRLHAS